MTEGIFVKSLNAFRLSIKIMISPWINSVFLLGVIGRLNYATDFEEVCKLSIDECPKTYSEMSPNAQTFTDVLTEDEPMVIKDNIVPLDKIATKHHAKLTAPDGIVIQKSTIPKAGLGAFATRFFADGVQFGPYRGEITWERGDTPLGHLEYAWQIESNNGTIHYVDSINPAKSNWMRYVNCARNYKEQNMNGYQKRGQIYYEAIRAIYPGEELFVYYGDEYAETLGFKIEKKNPPSPWSLYDDAYEVSVETGEQPDARTNARIYVTAEAEYDIFSFDLRDEDGSSFRRGQTDTYLVRVDRNAGAISRIRVGHDNTGESGGWFLVKLTMTGNITGRKLIFNCNCWLDPGNGTAWYQYIDAHEQSRSFGIHW